MSHFSISVAIGGYSDGSLTHAVVSFFITNPYGGREMHSIEVPIDADGPYESPEDMLRSVIPHVVEYV